MAFAFRDLISRLPLDGVILAARWQREDLDALGQTLDYLRGLGQRVIVIGPAMELTRWVGELAFHHGRLEGLDDWVGGFRVPERDEMDRLVGALSEGKGAEYYSAIDAFCPQGRCPVIGEEGRLLIVD